MSLNALGIAANIFGVVTPAKDIGEIIKSIADSVQEVKANEESTSYWDSTLQEHVKEVYCFMMQCRVAGANESQLRSLQRLFISLNILRKEIIENGRRSYLTKLLASGDIEKKIERVEKKMKHCQNLFVADTLSTHTGILLRVDRRVSEIADREGWSYRVESTAIRLKEPGKADSSDPMVFEYAYLAKKSHTLIYELKSNLEYVQERLLDTGNNIGLLDVVEYNYPVGSPLSECEDTSSRIIRACQMLRNRDFDDTSFIEWLIDNEGLSNSLYDVGLKKEARQLQEFICQMWSFLASRRGSAPIYSHLAFSLRELALLYSNEYRDAEALSLVDHAIQICRSLGDSFLPQLAKCLSSRSHTLRYLDRREESLESAQESVGILRRLVDDDLSLYGLQLVHFLRRQADAFLSLSRPEEALQCSQEALQWLSNTQYKQGCLPHYAWISWLIAVSHHNLEDFEQAKEYGRRALSVFHGFVRDRPLYYSHNLSLTLIYSSWFDHQLALSVLDESLTMCLTVDATFTAPHLANILDRRAAALILSSRCADALDSYDRAINVRRRLLEDEEDVDSKQFKALLKSFRLRASCLLSLHQQRDALSSLDAAQDAIVSRLKSEIGENIKTYIIRELEKERKLMEGCTGPDCIELIGSLRGCRKVLSHIHEIKNASRTGSTARSDLGILSILEYFIRRMVGSLDLALLSIQDAVDYYRSQVEQNRIQSNRADLVTCLTIQFHCCMTMGHLEQALLSIKDAMVYLRVDLDLKVEGSVSYFFEIFDLYYNNRVYFIDELGSHEGLPLFLETAIEILQSTIMISHSSTRSVLAWVLADKAGLLYNLGYYDEAISVYEESVDIRRKLVAVDESHKWGFAFSLYWLGKSQLMTDDALATAAWITVNEGIDVLIEEEDPYCISLLLKDLIFLRGDILFCLGRAPDVHDALLESLLLEITPNNQTNSESNGVDDSVPAGDSANNSGSNNVDESVSESI